MGRVAVATGHLAAGSYGRLEWAAAMDTRGGR